VMHLGLVATEFPPQRGGMSEVAHWLSEALADVARVSVVVPPGHGDEEAPYRLVRVLTDGGVRDATRLGHLEVDGWIVLQAGLFPLGSRLSQPAFGYVHGNDFLRPWVPCGWPWIEARQRPYASRLRLAHRRRCIRSSLRSIQHVYANSSMTKDLFARRYGLPIERVSVLPPGVPPDCFQDPVTRAESRPLELLTVARLSTSTRRKNIDGVLRALALLPASLPWHYRVVGGGDDQARLQVLAESLGLSQRVELSGRVDRADLLAAYRSADLFVLTPKATEGDVEGFGIVYLEANAVGVPVLGSKAGGAVDAIEHGVSGLLLEDSDPATIAAGIERFVSERSRFQSAEIVAHAARYRWEAIARRLHGDLIRQLDYGHASGEGEVR
jgi:phosphatidyl-myo-inositol dimannoside synthase